MTVIRVASGAPHEHEVKETGGYSVPPELVHEHLDYTEEITLDPSPRSVSISEEVQDFAMEILRKLPNVRLVPSKYNSGTKTKVFILDRKPCPFALGWISYRDFTDTAHFNPAKYGVWSPRIVNKRYKWGDKKHLLTSADMKIALRKVSASIRPYTPAELASYSYHEYTGGLRNSEWNIRRTEENLWSEIADNVALRPMVLSLLGKHEFDDAGLEEQIVTLKGHVDDRHEIARNSGGKLAHITMSDPERVIVTHLHPDDYSFTVAGCYTCAMSELPKEIKESIAVLSMVGNKFIEGTGIKLSDEIYFVQY